MGVEIWTGGEYENTGEGRMVSDVIRTLKDSLAPLADKCHILCNFNIPGFPGKKRYMSNIDMAVLRNRHFVILELKNYTGTISCAKDNGIWKCTGNDGNTVEIKGGREGRTPFGQVRDYRKQMSDHLVRNISCFQLGKNRKVAIDYKRYVSGVVVFPDSAVIRGDDFEHIPWFRPLRLHDLAEAVCHFGGGRGNELDDYETVLIVEKLLKLKRAHMVGDFPMCAAEGPKAPVILSTNTTVAIPAPVQISVPDPVRDEYGAIASVWNAKDSDVEKICQFVQLFKRIVWNKVTEVYKDTAVKSLYSGIENLLKGNVDLLKQAHRLRRLGNAVANETAVVSKADLDETFKTLCLLVRTFYEQEPPEALAQDCREIQFRDTARSSVPYEEWPKSIFAEVVAIDSAQRILSCRSVTGSEEEELKVLYSDGKDAFAKLADYVDVGSRICLVTPMLRDGVWKASCIVLEPDYLVSPQKIGQCVEYALPGVYFWLSLFEDRAEKNKKVPGVDGLTMEHHLLRGEFANACLADYCAGIDGRNFKDHMGAFFKSNPMALTAVLTAVDPTKAWVNDCRAADENLKRFVTEVIPREHHVNSRQWQIEAAFYSPIYGLAARADAIAYGPDAKSAMALELKSGKWDSFFRDNPRQEHAIQPIFYGHLLHFSLGIGRDHVNQLLLYSKTIPEDRNHEEKKGMLFTRDEAVRSLPPESGGTVGAAVSWIVNARNEIVALGEKVRSGAFREIIEDCEATDFKTERMGGLWRRKESEIVELLSTLKQADERTKRYFYRQVAFIAEEEYQARLGEKGMDIGRGGSSALWRTTVVDRQNAGLRLSELLVLSKRPDEFGRVTEIEFDTTQHPKNKNCSIRVGDAVCLYESHGDDAKSIATAIVFAAEVAELKSKSIVLKLQNPQNTTLPGISGTTFAVEPIPSTYQSSGYSGLRYFLTGDSRRRKLVLNQVRPVIDRAVGLPLSRQELERDYPPQIVGTLVDAWRAKDWFLIWGPPGTGKTSTAMRGLVDLAMAKPGVRILLLAYTYRATDEICKMLEKRIEEAHPHDSYLRLGNPLKCDPSLRGRMVDTIGFGKRSEFLSYVSKIRIVVAPVSAVSPGKPIFSLFKHFDLAIVDEASQLLDMHVLPLFCAKSSSDGRPLIGKFVFIGDDRQLPAVVKQSEKTSRIDDPMLRECGIVNCRHSFFERLRRIAEEKPEEKTSLMGMLKCQYRMHPEIAAFCTQFFYDNGLLDGCAPHQKSHLPHVSDARDDFERYTLGRRLGFYSVDYVNGDVDVKINTAEAACCARIVSVLTKRNAKPNCSTNRDCDSRPYEACEIGVIVPFRNQIAKVRDTLFQELGDVDADEILVDTVERFQGSERNVIIFSTVVQKEYQSEMISARRYDEIDDDGDDAAVFIDRKLNVAVTRAKERFYLVGNETLLRSLRAYGDLVAWISAHGGIYDVDDNVPT